MLRTWGLVFGLLVLWAGYFAAGLKPTRPDLLHSNETSLANNLSKIPTSPRWKFPFGNHNATKVQDGKYSFAESTVPIVSIETKDNAFFDYFTGIYIRGAREWEARKAEAAWWDWPANYRNRGRKWERKATIRFIGFNDTPLIQKAGIRINGNATRAFPQKSLRLVFREEYEKEGLDNAFFNKTSNASLKTLLLRNGGNDWDRAFLRDVLTSELSAGLELETQPARAVNVYLNGEYWGLHYLRPKIDDDYLAGKYGIADTSVSMIESPGVVYRGPGRGVTEFNRLLLLAQKSDLSDSLSYAKISAQFDIGSFIDYLLVNMLIVNTDWPQNNWLVWKDLSGQTNDGKWKWILKDTDYGLGFFDADAYNYNMVAKVLNNKGPIGILFYSLMQNPTFKSRFEERKIQMLATTWNTTDFDAQLDSLRRVLAPEMPYQIDRWRTHLSVGEWEDEVEDVREFYLKRLSINDH